MLLADYTLSGLRWANPSRVSYSTAPDGVDWGGRANSLNAALDGAVGGGWRREAARALQTWASVANLNIVRVADAALPLDAAGASQGDPRFGDIRLGGYDFRDPSTLAQTYFPPPASQTLGGDVLVNTTINWSIGSAAYDVYSVLLHETGHSLGLDHSAGDGPVMGHRYGGVRPGLTPDDVAGIQAIYGPRVPDAYRSRGLGGSFAWAVDATPGFEAGSRQATVGGLSLSTIGDTAYVSIVAPEGSSGSRLEVSALASGSSLLSPKVTVFDAGQGVLDAAANPGDFGNDVTARVGSVTAGSRYVVAVTGATGDVFSVGAFQLRFSFPDMVIPPPPPPPPPPPAPAPPAPTTPPPSPATPAPSPAAPITASIPAAVPPAVLPDRYEPNGANAAINLGRVGRATVSGLTLDTGQDVDAFAITTTRAGQNRVTASGARVQVLDRLGRVIADGANTVTFRSPRAGLRFYIRVLSADGAPHPGYTLEIAPFVPQVVRRVGRVRR